MTDPTPTDLLMGGGGRNVSWSDQDASGRYVTKPYGTTVTGTVDGELSQVQATDFTSGALKTWPDGKPVMQVIVPLQTQDRADNDDDGKRNLYIGQSSALQAAVRDAVKAAGAKGVQHGGTLSVTLTGETPTGKGNPAKQFSATYAPPAQGTVMEQAAPQPQVQSAQIAQQVMPQQVAPQPVQATPQAAQDPFAIAKKLRFELNMPIENVAAATGLTVEQVNAIPPF